VLKRGEEGVLEEWWGKEGGASLFLLKKDKNKKPLASF